jgi:hypothetical protein
MFFRITIFKSSGSDVQIGNLGFLNISISCQSKKKLPLFIATPKLIFITLI